MSRNVIIKKDEPWRDLVTDGHVWQARLNDFVFLRRGFYVLVLAIIAISYIPKSLEVNGFDKFIAAPIHYFSQNDVKEFQVLGSASFIVGAFANKNIKKATYRSDFKSFVDEQLIALNKTNELSNEYDYSELKVNAVWDDVDVIYQKKANNKTIFLGGIVRQSRYKLVPSVGVFHRENNNWKYYEMLNHVNASDDYLEQKYIQKMIENTFFKGEK